MDSISAPDTEKIRRLSDPKFKATGINKTTEEIFNGDKFNKVGSFDRATKFYGSAEEKRIATEGREDDYDDFIPKPDPGKKAPGVLDTGVKVGSSYVKRRKVIVWIVIAILVLAGALTFLPPVMSSLAEDTEVLYDRNVFEDMGMTEFKTYALANYSVFSEEAFSSELGESYRVLSLSVHLQNSSPFEVKIPQYKVSHVPKRYADRICYVTSTRTDSSGEVIGDTVPGFSGKDVTLEIMVNVADMTDEQLDEAITGLVLTTDGAEKRIASDKYIPCIPAFLFVSNNVTVSVNP